MKTSNITSQPFWDDKYGRYTPHYSLLDPFYGNRGLLAKNLLIWLKNAEDVFEIGCGSSRYMMFFSMVAGLKTYGIDFSREGLRNLELMARRRGVVHKLYFGDMFEHDMDGRKFDVVFHSGLVEHFSDLDLLFDRCRFFTKPKGLMIFLMPNMQNLAWKWHRRLCPHNFEAHIPYTNKVVADALLKYFRLVACRPWGYPQLYAGGTPESLPAVFVKYLNVFLILLIFITVPGYRGSVNKLLASTWLFVCRPK